MKTNFFLCITEYHVLLSILLAKEEYNNDTYVNCIVLCNEGRFTELSRYDLSVDGGIEYLIFDERYVKSSSFIDFVQKNCTGSLFIFNLNNPQFIYLAYKLKKSRQASSSFVQEGLATYNRQSYTIRERLSRIKTSFLILYKAGIRDLEFYYLVYGYKGRFGGVFDYYEKAISINLIAKLWVSYPKDALFGKKKIKKLPDFTPFSIKAANSFFKYRDSISLNKNDIVYIDQRIEGSVEFISELSASFQNTNIYIKLHPRTKQDWAERYQKMPNVRVLSFLQGIPVELFLQNLSDAIVITPFSSALLIVNPKCRFYYTYKWHINHGYNIENDSLFVPGTHISIIESIREIELF